MKINVRQSFHVLEITSEEAQSEVNSLDSRKLGSYKNKPTKYWQKLLKWVVNTWLKFGMNKLHIVRIFWMNWN